QSIGEPGTQLTMRTFHTGGIAGAQEDITQGLPRVEELFESRVPKDKAIVSELDGNVEVVIEENGTRKIRVVNRDTINDDYPLTANAEVLVSEGEQVAQHQVIARLAATAKDKRTDAEREVRARSAGTVVVVDKKRVQVRFEEREEREYTLAAAMNILAADG